MQKMPTDLAFLVLMVRHHIDAMKECKRISDYEGERTRFEDRMDEWADTYMNANE